MRATTFLVLASALIFAVQANAQKPRTILEGVYTADQAARGEAVFTAHCKVCHRSEFFSSPEALALRGPSFIERWREDTIGSLFNKMRGYMPPPNVSPRLKDSEYLDIIAFLLESSGYPGGAAELTADHIAGIQFVDKDGPKPVPNLSQILVVGCLTAGPSDSWTLTHATEPVRTRTPEESTPEELKNSEETALGSLTFQLRGLDNLPPGFSINTQQGHKVQTKGVLNRQSAGDRISVLSMVVVSQTCGN